MQVIVCLEPTKKKLLKDVFFALQLGFQVIGSFLIAVYLGLKIDNYFNSKPIAILSLLFLAFGYIIKTLLGVYKDE